MTRRLILKMSMSLDGFVGGPNGEIDWLFRSMDAEATAWTVETLWRAGAHLMGGRTFRDMAAFWPTSAEPFAAPMNEIPKVVFSRGGAAAAGTTQALTDARARAGAAAVPASAAEGNWATARLATGDLADEIARCKREPGRDLLAHGGASFAQSLVERGLVDEYRLLVHPVVLGRGLPLFARLAAPADLALVEARTFPGGAIAHVYRTRSAA
ncbi:MAG TPA: dihydrofolate reductase family protein [Polyangia bacterium]|jgi:dihydrofolate reductase|nr:dihydrofolate reductase family protein [Polyangia bacterium]